MTGIRSPSLVTADQSGEFYAAGQWYPFNATLLAMASTTNPGFVWDARMTILNLSNRVLEYYVTITNNNNNNNNTNNSTGGGKGGEGNIITKVWGKYPLIQIEEEDPYILFWLAMTPMFPSVLLQQQGRSGVLNWINSNSRLSAHDNLRTCATARLVTVGDGTFLVEYFFREEDDLLIRIKVTSSTCLNGDDEPWQAFYDDYKHLVSDFESEDGDGRQHQRQQQQQQQQRRPLLVPSKIEIGKGEGDQYRPHLKINNHHLEYRWW